MTDRSTEDHTDDPLTLPSALADFGWFSLALAVIAGPSYLSLLQLALVTHNILDPLVWITEAYHDLAEVVGAIVGPIIGLALLLLNNVFGLELSLHTQWRVVFLVGLLLTIALARVFWHQGNKAHAVRSFVILIIIALLAAAWAGVSPPESHEMQNAILSTLPLQASAAALLAMPAMRTVEPQYFAALILPVALALVSTAVLSIWIEWPSYLASMMAYIGFVLFWLSVAFLLVGISSSTRTFTRLGLTLLGSLASAGVIVIADRLLVAST